jgi:hypothetical protein
MKPVVRVAWATLLLVVLAACQGADLRKLVIAEVNAGLGVVSVAGISLDKSSTTIPMSGTDQLIATVTPADASNKNVTWSTSDATKAAISPSGLVTGVAAGNASITVTTADGNKTASCAVTVTSQVFAPQFTPGDGSYTSAQNVTISCTPGSATIRYTTDGSAPSETAGTVYSSPINVSTNLTLKAIAYKAGMDDSLIASASYAFVPPGSPTISSAAAGSGQVTVTWATVPGATSYNLYWMQGSTVDTGTYNTKILNAVSPKLVTGLANGNQYAFIVTAVGGYGEGAASPVVTAVPAPQWTVVGSADFSAGQVNFNSLALDSSDTPYVAYMDIATTPNGLATVMKYDGSSWVTVGSAGFSVGAVNWTSLAISSGTPYVAFFDSGEPTSGKATVMTYNGSSWSAVGTAGFSMGQAYSTSLAIHGGTLYVAYLDVYYGNKVTVMTSSGSNWSALGTAGFYGRINAISLAIAPNGTPYIAFTDSTTTPANKLTVMKFTTSWVLVGTAGISTAAINGLSLAIDSANNPYVAYSNSANGNKVTVMEYSTGSWATVGSADFSGGAAGDISLVINSNTPYVAYADGANSAKATVMKFDGLTWVTVGSAGFSPGEARYTSLAFDSIGTPYISYSDWANGSMATVMKFW